MKSNLELSLDGILLTLHIDGYNGNKLDIDDWCKTTLQLKSEVGNWLDYRIESQEVLLNSEINYLIKYLNKLLQHELKESQLIEFAEPDISFKLSPELQLSKTNKISETATLIISFWDKNCALSANQLSIELDTDDIQKLKVYLESL